MIYLTLTKNYIQLLFSIEFKYHMRGIWATSIYQQGIEKHNHAKIFHIQTSKGDRIMANANLKAIRKQFWKCLVMIRSYLQKKLRTKDQLL